MIKGKKYLKKQVVASVLALSMAAASLTGCSNGLSSSKKESSNVGTMTQEEASTTKVMVIGDYDIYMDELLVYAIQAMVTNNGTLASVKANPDTYKEQTLSLIRTTKILYDVTQHNDVTLDDSDMETTNNTINNFLKSMPDGLLEKYGISEDVVRKVFTEQTYVSKFENDIKNDMGKTIQDDVEEKVKDYNFMVFDYILFPTVETTEDDTPATNTDGSYKYVDDAAKQKAKENAEALLKELEAGGDAETLATKYGVSNYYFERTGYVGSFTDSINKAVENMKENPHGLVFYDYNKEALISTSQVNCFYHRVCEKCGLKCDGQHALRHTFATRCIEAGIPAVVLKKWLGHKSIDITLDTYADVFDRMNFNAVEKLEDYIETFEAAQQAVGD